MSCEKGRERERTFTEASLEPGRREDAISRDVYARLCAGDVVQSGLGVFIKITRKPLFRGRVVDWFEFLTNDVHRASLDKHNAVQTREE